MAAETTRCLALWGHGRRWDGGAGAQDGEGGGVK